MKGGDPLEVGREAAELRLPTGLRKVSREVGDTDDPLRSSQGKTISAADGASATMRCGEAAAAGGATARRPHANASPGETGPKAHACGRKQRPRHLHAAWVPGPSAAVWTTGADARQDSSDSSRSFWMPRRRQAAAYIWRAAF